MERYRKIKERIICLSVSIILALLLARKFEDWLLFETNVDFQLAGTLVSSGSIAAVLVLDTLCRKARPQRLPLFLRHAADVAAKRLSRDLP